MHIPSDFFSLQGEPFQEERITELRKISNSRLPEDYLEFLSCYGGGIISERYSHVYIDTERTSKASLEATMIFGEIEPMSLWENSILLDPVWLYDWAFYFCEASNPPEDKFLINLSNEDFSIGCILYEDDGEFIQVAADFTSFLSNLINNRCESFETATRSEQKFGNFHIPAKKLDKVEFPNRIIK